MIKILVITPFFYPHVGGSQQYMEDLYVNLRKKHPEISVDILCYNTDYVEVQEKYRGLNIYRISCLNILTGKFSLPNPNSLWHFLTTHKDYDLIHTSTRFFDSSWWAPIYAKLTNKKIILTDHCAQTPTTSNPLINLLVFLVDRVTGKLFLPMYGKIFVVSRATKSFLKKTFGVYSKVIYAGADLNFSKKPAAHKKIQVLFAGRMIEEKGVKLLFHVAKQMPQINFIFAGPGQLKENLPNVFILGKRSKKQLNKLLSRADIFVYPTYHSEGIPIALLEAGANKLPVIACDIGGIKEVIKDNQTGLLIKPKDEKSLKEALEKLIAHQSLRKELGHKLFLHIRDTFNWQKSAELFYQHIHAKI